MKLSLKLIAAIGLGGLSSVSAQTKLNLTGIVAHAETGKVYLQKFSNKMFTTIDSSQINNGKFSFATAVELPELYGLTFDQNKNPLYVFLDNKATTVNLDSVKYYRSSTVSGSVAQDLFNQYRKTKSVKIEDFIKENPSSIVSAYVLYREWSYRLTPAEIEQNIANLDRTLDKTPYVQVLKGLVPVLKSVQPGNRALDFELPDANGKNVKLSDHFGKYLLVDFWASWCPPCRAENPNVVKLFQKYKSKGFDVFGVSLDKSKENWLKAIKDDHLDWTQVSDLQFWNSAGAKIYGVMAIPANVLIDPNGVIIARNLYGADLEKKLEEIFSAK
ncbi:TlpA disulfide reductase family protein [Pedobacter punctiformis]|uniref:TlpA disulfide reductase family protein n=1 Tax=Pedobacter punctiformis TaxID=3004097 RepID=A0ABT4LD50_9SPHI|nr:TlpA disulfide reductase family protein [Pedobacter sp. HCMS5-2]MCZ4245830.1 TlpA disulfide reductase family protein [Pedobacter sp. HCMS5-2]